MGWLFFGTAVFAAAVVVSFATDEWTAAIVALFAEFYFLNQMYKKNQ